MTPDPYAFEGYDIAVYTVRDTDDRIVAEFRTEDEALAYGSYLANANPDDLYTVVCGRWMPSPEWIDRKSV